MLLSSIYEVVKYDPKRIGTRQAASLSCGCFLWNGAFGLSALPNFSHVSTKSAMACMIGRALVHTALDTGSFVRSCSTVGIPPPEWSRA